MEEKIKAARTRLAVDAAFFGSILLNTEFRSDDKCPSYGATDGVRKIFYNPVMCKDLSVGALIGLILHEVMHIAYLHMLRKEVRDHELWNIATDIVINLQILDMGHELPEGGLIRPEFKGLSAEEVYEQIKDDPEYRAMAASGEGAGMDVHLDPEGSESENQERVRDVIARAWEAHKASGKKRGELPADLERLIKDLLDPKVPWQRELARYVGSVLAKEDFTFYPPSRRHLMDDIYLPSVRSHKLGSVVLSIDSSGSCGDILPQFAAESKAIFQEVEEVTIIVSDACVQEVVASRDVGRYLQEMKIKGGGGTDHRPVFDFIKEKGIVPELFIGLTDGYSAFPDKKPNYPVLWCLTPEHGLPPWGRSVVIND